MVRGRGAFGRRPDRSVLSEISKGGPVSVHHYDGTDKTTTVETVQNVNPIIDANVRDYSNAEGGFRGSDLKRVASIPMIEVHKLLQQGIDIFNADDWKKVVAKLDSPDWLKFRTAPGHIGRKPVREYFKASTGS